MTDPGSDAAPGAPNRYIIAAGCSTYDHLDEAAQLPGVEGEIDEIVRLTDGWGYQRVLDHVSLNRTGEEFTRELGRWLIAAERNPDDVVIVYWSGHGHVDEVTSTHQLLHRESEPGLLAATSWEPSMVFRLLANSPVRQLLLIVDACYAGHAGGELAQVAHGLAVTSAGPATGGARALCAVTAARPKQEADTGAFAAALTHASGHPPAGDRQEYLSLGSIVRGVNGYLEQQKAVQRASWSAYEADDLLPFVPNIGHKPGLPTELDVAAARAMRTDQLHWETKGRGVARRSESEGLFFGRTATLAEIDAFLDPNRQPGWPLLVVTGQPGAGKSTVVAQFVSDSTTTSQTVEVALHARNRSVVELARQLTTATETDTQVDSLEDLPPLVADLAGRRRPLRVAVDALDEATDPDRVRTMLIAPLAGESRAAGGSVRLLVGSRREQADQLTAHGRLLDLDTPEYLDEDDILAFVERTLASETLPGTAHYTGRQLTDVATAVAARADGNFLIGRLLARDLRDRHGPIATNTVGWSSRLPATIGDVFDQWLRRFGDDEQRVRDLLKPLAYAQGAGLPWDDIWAPAATVICGTTYTDADIGWLLDHAGSYLLEDTAHDRSVFRLFHQSLADHLTDHRRHRTIHTRLVQLLLSQVPERDGRPDWARAHPYTCDNLSTHAARADPGTLDTVLTEHPQLLAVADPLALSRDLPMVVDDWARRLSAVYLTAAHNFDRRADRPSYLALAAHHIGDRQVASCLDERIRDRDSTWFPEWSVVRPTGPHRTVIDFSPGTRVLALEQLSTRLVLVTGGRDGALRVWDTGDGTEMCRLSFNESGIHAAAVGASSDGSPVVVVGCDDGSVRAFDIHREATIWEQAVQRGGNRPVWAVAVATNEDGRPIAVAGGTDGRLRAWSLADGAPMWMTALRHSGPVSQLAVGSQSGSLIVASTGTDGVVRVWRIQDGQPALGGPLRVADDRIGAIAVGNWSGHDVVVASGVAGTLFKWDLQADSLLGKPILDHETPVRAIVLGDGEDGPVFVTVGVDGVVTTWDLISGRSVGHPLRTTYGSPTNVTVALRPADGQPVVASATYDGRVRVWDTPPVSPAPAGDSSFPGQVRSVLIARHGDQQIVVTGGDFNLRYWDSSDGRPIRGPLTGHGDHVNALAVAERDGVPTVVSASEDASVRMWRLEDGASVGDVLVRHREGDDSGIRGMAVCKFRGRPVVVSAGDRTTRLADVDGQFDYELTELKGPTSAVTATVLDDDRSVVVLGGTAIRVWDLAGERMLGEFMTGDGWSVSSLAVARIAGQPSIVAGCSDGSVRQWDLMGCAPLKALRSGPAPAVTAVTVLESQEQPAVVSGSIDGVVRAFDFDSLAARFEVRLHSRVNALSARRGQVIVGMADGLQMLRI